MTSARMNPFSMSVWMAPAACPAGAVPGDHPGPYLVLADGKKGDHTQEAGELAEEPRRAQLLEAVFGEEGRPFFLRELGDFGFDPAAESRAPAIPLLAGQDLLRGFEERDILLVAVEHVEERLLAEEGEAPDRLFFGRGRPELADGLPLPRAGPDDWSSVLSFSPSGSLAFFRSLSSFSSRADTETRSVRMSSSSM